MGVFEHSYATQGTRKFNTHCLTCPIGSFPTIAPSSGLGGLRCLLPVRWDRLWWDPMRSTHCGGLIVVLLSFASPNRCPAVQLWGKMWNNQTSEIRNQHNCSCSATNSTVSFHNPPTDESSALGKGTLDSPALAHVGVRHRCVSRIGILKRPVAPAIQADSQATDSLAFNDVHSLAPSQKGPSRSCTLYQRSGRPSVFVTSCSTQTTPAQARK